jgi:hypothetical protein
MKSYNLVKSEGFRVVAIKNSFFRDVTQCGSYKNHFLQEPHGITSQKMAFFRYNLALPDHPVSFFFGGGGTFFAL